MHEELLDSVEGDFLFFYQNLEWISTHLLGDFEHFGCVGGGKEADLHVLRTMLKDVVHWIAESAIKHWIAESAMQRSWDKLSSPLSIMCRIRPGVPITTCGPVRRIRMHSPTGVPPTHSATESPFKFVPKFRTTSNVWFDNSRVGERITTWGNRFAQSTIESEATVNAPVFPLPLCACATMSRPSFIGTMTRSWIVVGFSQP